MLKHIVLFSFKDAKRASNIEDVKKIKQDLEILPQKIEGLISLHVVIEPESSSNRDLMLECVLTDKEALSYYATHPEHVKVSQQIGEIMENRTVIDYFLEH